MKTKDCIKCQLGSLCVLHRPGGPEFWDKEPDNWKTMFCVECRHRGFYVLTRCFAPEWEKSLDFVSGTMKPAYFSCHEKNTEGKCPHFKPRLLRRMWNALLSTIIAP